MKGPELLDFINGSRLLGETVNSKLEPLEPLLHWKIFGVKPFLSLLLRLPFLGKKLLKIDWRVSERVVENNLLYTYLPLLGADPLILDTGSAESMVPFELASLGYRVVATDIREYPVSHPLLSFVPANIFTLPFKDGTFDLACAISTVEHLGLPSWGIEEEPDGDKKGVAEIARCLKPGGLFYLTVPFGKKQVTWQRFYDWPALSGLVTGFELVSRKFYGRTEAKYWRETEQETLEARDTASARGVDGVALLLLRKNRAPEGAS